MILNALAYSRKKTYAMVTMILVRLIWSTKIFWVVKTLLFSCNAFIGALVQKFGIAMQVPCYKLKVNFLRTMGSISRPQL